MAARLAINASHVVHETIDGEAILIHLGTGTYYSLNGVGAEVWEAAAAGADPDQLLAAARERYESDPSEVEQALRRLLEELLREELLVEDGAEPRAEPPRLPAGSVPFAAPVLRVYTDMQGFMLVDPLHEVDEAAGWPHAKPG